MLLVNDFAAEKICKLGNLQAWKQRGILGATAFATQPFIDLKNKNTDEQTRKYSAVRTGIKIAVGTTVGVITRALALWAGNKLVKDELIKPLKKLDIVKFDRYKSSVCNILACIATTITAFTIDIPVTKKSLDYFLGKLNLTKPQPEKLNESSNLKVRLNEFA